MKLSIPKQKIAKMSSNPGVYLFYGGRKKLLYVGKATNLRSRVGSYFRNASPFGKGGQEGDLKNKVVPQIPPNPPFPKGGGRPIEMMIHEVTDIKTIETESVLEALILESNLIKKLQPKYNAMGKDDKSFSYFIITKEEFPRILIVRKTDIAQISNSKFLIPNQIPKTKKQISKNILDTKYQIPYTKAFGPYTSKKQMEIALKIVRKIFPFHSGKQKTEKGCLDFQIGTCPGPYAGAITRADYLKNIQGIRMILEGRKKNLVKKMEKEMRELADRHEYERASETRNKIYALKHIRDIALISRDENFQFPISNFQTNLNDQISKMQNLRIEAYDISNISGQYAVGSMVVFENGEPDKSQYRKFKIKTVEGSDDVGMMREVLLRRFNNDWPASTREDDRSSTRGWPLPDLILLDGGQGHLNMGAEVLKKSELNIPLAAVAKGQTRKISNFQFLISKQFPISQFSNEIKNIINDRNLIWTIMSEAHRFAVGYHRKLRKKSFGA